MKEKSELFTGYFSLSIGVRWLKGKGIEGKFSCLQPAEWKSWVYGNERRSVLCRSPGDIWGGAHAAVVWSLAEGLDF